MILLKILGSIMILSEFKENQLLCGMQMLGCGAHVRIIALPHVRCACGSACGKGLELCVRKCVRMGDFQGAICDRTFLPVMHFKKM